MLDKGKSDTFAEVDPFDAIVTDRKRDVLCVQRYRLRVARSKKMRCTRRFRR